MVVLFTSGNGEITSLTTACIESYGCASSTLSDDYVECYGYEACSRSTITATKETICAGYESCLAAKITGGSDGTIKCNGYHGCIFATIESSNVTYCSSSGSCRISTLKSTNILYANGPKALEYADISGTSIVYVRGYKALSLSKISSTDVSSLEINVQVEHGVDGTKLYCWSGDQCVVNCDLESSCDGLEFYCQDGATCTINCNDDCATCPSIISYNPSLSGYIDQLDIISAHREKYQELDTLDLLDAEYHAPGINDIIMMNDADAQTSKTSHMLTRVYSDFGGQYVFYLIVWIVIVIVVIGIYQIYKWIANYCSNNNNNKNYQYQPI